MVLNLLGSIHEVSTMMLRNLIPTRLEICNLINELDDLSTIDLLL